MISIREEREKIQQTNLSFCFVGTGTLVDVCDDVNTHARNINTCFSNPPPPSNNEQRLIDCTLAELANTQQSGITRDQVQGCIPGGSAGSSSGQPVLNCICHLCE